MLTSCHERRTYGNQKSTNKHAQYMLLPQHSYDGPLAFLLHLFKEITFIEFKSISDPVDAGIFKRICGHFGHYADQNKLSWQQWRESLAGIAIAAHGAHRIIDDWKNSDVRFQEVRHGVFLTHDPWKFVLIDLETINQTKKPLH